MRLALMQAQRNLGNTKENPSVGCVISHNNNLISAACTSVNGRPHAEQNAIKFCKYNLKNTSLFVTLEPCSHYGKTKPCVKSIIKNKFNKVFFSIKDPDIRSYNKSKKILKKHKIKVEENIFAQEIKPFYNSYFKFKSNKLPFITAKIAVSKDLFLNNKKNKWITNVYSRGRVHLMRSSHDCIITSVKTVISDNPLLNCRIAGLEKTSPTRIILDKKLKIPLNSKIVKSSKKHKTIVFFNKNNKKKIQALKQFKIKAIKFPINDNGDFELKKILAKIKLLGFSRIFLESGLNLFTNFLKNGLIDELYLFISNQKLGINGRNSLKKNINLFFKKIRFTEEKVNLFGDKLIHYRIK